MADAFIIDACRTPRAIGKPGKGAFAGMHPQHVAAIALSAIASRNDLDTADVDDVIWSTSAQRGRQGGDLARMAALDAGYSVLASGTTLDRFCGGGITAVALAAGQIMGGMEDLIVAGGVEMMSVSIAEPAAASAGPFIMGAGNARLQARHPQSHQGVCADAIAARENITRIELDAYAARSQARAARAVAEGRFTRSLVPVRDEFGVLRLETDEYPRPETTRESLAALSPSFGAAADAVIGGTDTTYRGIINSRYPDLDIVPVHHAGNSSGVVDGAAALLLASAHHVARHRLQPRARVVAAANAGDDPTLMLNAPVPAIRKVLARAGLMVDDIAVWEINEAFAVVVEKCIRDLSLDPDKVNINGGAIALGHPIGATGAMLIGTALDELERTGGRYALITMCAAGGMAPAIVIERL